MIRNHKPDIWGLHIRRGSGYTHNLLLKNIGLHCASELRLQSRGIYCLVIRITQKGKVCVV